MGGWSGMVACKSKIICTFVISLSLSRCLLLMRDYSWYYSGSLIEVWTWLLQLSCSCYSVNITVSITEDTKEEQGAAIRFRWSEVCQGLILIRDFYHNTATVFYCVEVSMRWSRSLKEAGKAWRTKKEHNAYQSPPLTKRHRKRERW